jgi:hypothetical protein
MAVVLKTLISIGNATRPPSSCNARTDYQLCVRFSLSGIKSSPGLKFLGEMRYIEDKSGARRALPNSA